MPKSFLRVLGTAFACLAMAIGWTSLTRGDESTVKGDNPQAQVDDIRAEAVIDFEQVPIRLDPDNDEIINRLERYEEAGVEFRLARQPEKSKARGQIMFFPHISSGHRGILNAMANEQEIPLRVTFPHEVSAVKIVFWASTGAAAELKAFDAGGAVVARDALSIVPGRKTPEDPIPTFQLSVEAEGITHVEFSGPRTGEFLVADEVRFVPAQAR